MESLLTTVENAHKLYQEPSLTKDYSIEKFKFNFKTVLTQENMKVAAPTQSKGIRNEGKS